MTVEYHAYRITIATIHCDYLDCSRRIEYRGGLNQAPPFRKAIRRQMRVAGWGTTHTGDLWGGGYKSDLCKEHLEESRGQLTIEEAIENVD